MIVKKDIIRKDVISITLPILAEQVFIVLMGTVNTVMAGHINNEAFSAIGMVNSINNIFIAFFSAIAIGSTVVVANNVGRNRISEANETAKQAVASGFLLSVAITALIWIFRIPMVNVLFGAADPRIINDSFIYLGITLLTYPLISVTSVACGLLRGAGDTRTPAAVSIFMNVANVILSYVLIFGIDIHTALFSIKFGSMGVVGAALGIAIARVLGALIIMYTLLKGSKVIKIDRFFPLRFDMRIQRFIYGIGVPSSVESLMFNAGKLITQVFIVGMGTVAIAANQVAGTIGAFINVPGIAFSISVTTLVGQSMGRGDVKGAKSTMAYMTVLSSVCLLAISIVLYPLAGPLSSIFINSSNVSGEITSMSASVIRLLAIVTPIFWSTGFLIPAGLKGAGDVKYTLVTAVASMWLIRITMGYILGVPLKMGVAGIWLGMYMDWVIRSILYLVRLKNEKWKYRMIGKGSKGNGINDIKDINDINEDTEGSNPVFPTI